MQAPYFSEDIRQSFYDFRNVFMMMSACHLRVEILLFLSSMTFSARTTEGTQTYACDEGVWMKVGSSAKLVNSRGGKLGFFQSAYDCKKRHSNMRWTLYNSAGDQAESGFATSSISGNSSCSTVTTIANWCIAETFHPPFGHILRVPWLLLWAEDRSIGFVKA